jgi:hypothetical protein
MPVYIKTIKSGNVIEKISVKSKKLGMPAFRSGAYLPNKDAAKRKAADLLNNVRELARIINCNFKKGDLFITLTVRGANQPSYEEMEQLVRKFLRAVRTVRKLRGMDELKYVSVIEDKKRIHVHMVLNKMSVDELMDLWPHGKVLTSHLEPNGEYTGIAHYITKEPRHPHKKRWSQSRNLKKPEISYEEVGRSELEADFDQPKGYREVYSVTRYLDECGLYRYAKYVKYGTVDLAVGRNEIDYEQLEVEME